MKRRRHRKKILIMLAAGICLLFFIEAGKPVRPSSEGAAKESGDMDLPELPDQKVAQKEDQKKDQKEDQKEDPEPTSYYYEQLPEEEKETYRKILQGIMDGSEKIYFHAETIHRANEILNYVMKDHPEIFWCDGAAKITRYEGGKEYTVLAPVYTCTGKEREQRQTQIEEEVKKCLAGISRAASDYDKILYVFEYIVNTVEYDAGSKDNQNIYSVFGNKRSVCAGYSKATQYLLERLGVFCTYVTGTTKNGDSHAWNLVICDGDYYYVDTTWGDPVFLDSEQAIDCDYISYDYMCCNEEELLKTHTPDPDVSLPRCTKMEDNYYIVNQMFYREYNSGKVREKMEQMIREKKNPSVFKFADKDSYKKAREDIFGNLVEQAAQDLADRYGLSQVKYTYIDDPELNKIVIYWKYE